MRLPSEVKIVEVGPRDGLQAEKTPLTGYEIVDFCTFCKIFRKLGGGGALPPPQKGPEHSIWQVVYAQPKVLCNLT